MPFYVGGAKIHGIVKKNYLNCLYKFEKFSPLQSTPPATGCSNPSTAPNGNAVKGRQRIVGSP